MTNYGYTAAKDSPTEHPSISAMKCKSRTWKLENNAKLKSEPNSEPATDIPLGEVTSIRNSSDVRRRAGIRYPGLGLVFEACGLRAWGPPRRARAPTRVGLEPEFLPLPGRASGL